MDDPMTRLKERLASASTPDPGEEVVNLPRRTALHAVDAVNRYLAEMGVDFSLRAPLLHIIGAFQDSDAGKQNPLFTPGEYTRPVKIVLAHDMAEYVAASAAVDILAKVPGASREKDIARMARAIGAPPAKLKEFRRNLGRGKAPEAARSERDEWMNDWFVQQKKGATPQEFVDYLIKFAKALRPKNG